MRQFQSETIFLQKPEEAKHRTLHPVAVTDQGDGVAVRLEEPEFQLAAGDDVFVFFEQDREFMKQPATVTAVMTEPEGSDDGPPARIVALETSGEAVSAESRQCYRVCTVMSRAAVTFGAEAGCPLADVSVQGFAVIASTRHSIGDTVPVTIGFEGESVKGSGSIQSIKKLDKERFRYGLLAVDDAKHRDALRKGLQRLSMSIQRSQLRRRARA